MKLETIKKTFFSTLLGAVNDAKEPASNWLSAMSPEKSGFVLNKKEFCNVVSLCYAEELKWLPSKCPCGQTLNITETLNYKTRSFVKIHRSKLRDFKAHLLEKTCNDVEIEPALQPIERKIVGLTGDNGTLDAHARSF